MEECKNEMMENMREKKNKQKTTRPNTSKSKALTTNVWF